MKIKIIAGTMVALSFSLMSCSDFLTEDPRGTYPAEKCCAAAAGYTYLPAKELHICPLPESQSFTGIYEHAAAPVAGG